MEAKELKIIQSKENLNIKALKKFRLKEKNKQGLSALL